MRATLAYTSARVLLFVAALVILYVIGARGLALLALALLVSGIASFLVLSKARDRMSASLSDRLSARQASRETQQPKTSSLRARFEEFGARLDEGAAVEDDE
jgi:Mn2+/Fe2+ NRAMP family transporter